MPRLFVAVRPPPDVLDRLEALDRTARVGVRYTRRDQWHVTLRFFGEVDLAVAAAALRTVRAPRAEALLDGTVTRFGGGALVLPVHGLDGLAAEVVTATAAVGRPPEARPFAGHLTVARRRGRAARSPLPHGALSWSDGGSASVPFAVEELELIRSSTADGGARYTTELVVPLD